MRSDTQIAVEYQNNFDVLEIRRGAAVEASAQRILKGWDRYLALEKLTGVPAAFIGALHDRECSCDFRGVLHNGEKILGTGRKTRLEPRGRGPFRTWEEAALDALKIKGLVGQRAWTVGECLEKSERFNGLGYRNHGWSNPYLWGGTQFYTTGKYVRDHVYSATFKDPQTGVAPVMKRVEILTGDPIAITPMQIVLNDKGKLRPADKQAIIANSRSLRFGEWFTSFCEYLGLGSISLATVVPTVAGFLVDWRTLAVFGVLGGGYVAMKLSKFHLLNAAKQGRYVPSGFFRVEHIPAADKDTDGVWTDADLTPPSPPSADAGSVAVPSAPTDPALIASLGQPAMEVETEEVG